MDIALLEAEVLKLSALDRARLVRVLLDSLDDLPPQELERLWFDEAGRRATPADNEDPLPSDANVSSLATERGFSAS